jgi:hypothetical protein
MTLRRFATANERIVMHQRAGDRHLETTVNTACAEVGFYEISAADIDPAFQDMHDPEIIEKTLSGIETDAKRVFDAMLSGSFPLTAENKFHTSLLLALQINRGWDFREKVAQIADSLMPYLVEIATSPEKVRAFLREHNLPMDEASIESFRADARKNPPRLVAGKTFLIQEALRAALRDTLPHLLHRSWRILRFESPCLLTSDHPFGYWSPANKRISLGIGNAPVVYYPLDRTSALAMHLRSRTEEFARVAGFTRAHQINALVASEASKWIFHHPDDRPLEGIDLAPKAKPIDDVVQRWVDSDGLVHEVHRLSWDKG